MSEQELYMMSDERARDEVGAANMLKKHGNTEKTVEDYAEVVKQLGDRARQLIDENHPDKYVTVGINNCFYKVYLGCMY